MFDGVVLCSKEWWWLMLVVVVEPDSGMGMVGEIGMVGDCYTSDGW
jgi:hypothetical protein